MTSGTGTCSVMYDQAGDDELQRRARGDRDGEPPARRPGDHGHHARAGPAVYGSQFTVRPRARSGDPVTYSSGGACSNSGATFTMTSGTTACQVKYDQAGNANYNAAPEVTESVTADEGRPVDHGDDACAGQCGLRVALHGRRERAGRRDHVLERRRLLEQRRDVHDDERQRHVHRQVRPGRQQQLQRRAEVTESVNASKAAQAITVMTHAPGSAVYRSGFSVAATGGASGNPVTFSSSGGCSNSGASFTMTSGTTACQVKYDEAGGANYSAAPTVIETVTASKAGQAITVTTHAPRSAVYNTGFSVAATGGASGNAVSFSSAGACSNSGAAFTMTSGTGDMLGQVRPGRRQQLQRGH